MLHVLVFSVQSQPPAISLTLYELFGCAAIPTKTLSVFACLHSYVRVCARVPIVMLEPVSQLIKDQLIVYPSQVPPYKAKKEN